MGHTILTHSYLLRRSQPPLCPSCNVALTIPHIIGHCPALTNKELQSKISSHVENTEKLSLQMKELEEINSNMCCTIQLLEEENRVSAQEIKRLEDKQDGRSRVEGNEEIIEISEKYTTADVTCDDAPTTLADRLRIPSNIGSITDTTESGSGTTNTQKLTRILIVGDELARNSSPILNSYVSSDVTVEGIVKPGVEFCDLVIPLFHQSMHLGKDDHIIVMFSTINVSNYKLLQKALQILLPLSKVTNVTIMCKRSSALDIGIETFIYSRIRSFIQNNRNSSINFITNIKYKRQALQSFYIKSRNNNTNNNIVLKLINLNVSVSQRQFFRE
nr:unnamed protein product [Callosobruchus chinensis]